MSSTADTIKQLIRTMNAAWLSGRIDELERFFADAVIFVPPANGERLIGKKEVLDSFRQYADQAKTHVFEEQDLQVDAMDSTAVAKLHFRVRYEYQGQMHEEEGSDILVLSRFETGWQIIWRTQLAQAAETAN